MPKNGGMIFGEKVICQEHAVGPTLFPRRDMDYDVADMIPEGVQKHGTKLLICMVGLSGCGKTYASFASSYFME